MVVIKYKSTKKVPKEKYYEVYINADSNDADYISRTSNYSQKEFDEIVDALIDLINNYDGEHELEDYPNDMELSIPNSDNGCCHTLEELTITMYDIDGYVYGIELKPTE